MRLFQDTCRVSSPSRARALQVSQTYAQCLGELWWLDVFYLFIIIIIIIIMCISIIIIIIVSWIATVCLLSVALLRSYLYFYSFADFIHSYILTLQCTNAQCMTRLRENFKSALC
jgi:hypothetical protein